MAEVLRQEQVFVTVDLLILTVREGRLSLLLLRRADPPFRGRWGLPGELMAREDCAEAAAQRLLRQTLPLDGAFMEQLYTFTAPDRDPRGRVISIAYLAAAPWARLSPLLRGGGEGARLFDVSLAGGALGLEGGEGLRLAGEDLAFDHGRVIETGVQRLRGKIDYTDIAFEFLNDPRAFTLGELQAVFEAVLERTVDASNFRRTIQKRYEETGRIAQVDTTDRPRQRRRGRPAAVYRMTGG